MQDTSPFFKQISITATYFFPNEYYSNKKIDT